MFFARTPLQFPPDLAAALEKNLPPRKELGAALRALWPKLAKGRGKAVAGEQHYSFRREEAAAYAAYYLPVNCLKPALVLEESFLCGIDPMPSPNSHWLDLGTGPGTALWGLAWWAQKRKRNFRFTGWDQSPQFTAIARSLAGGAPFGTKADFHYGEDPLTLVRKHQPTHVSFMNSIAEIYPNPALRLKEVCALLRALTELEKKDGRPRFLLILEPGSRESSRELAELKDALQRENLATVQLPCFDSRLCGALVNPNDWCHEEASCEFPTWLNELGAEAGMRKEALLFSYVWLRAGTEASSPLKGAMRIVSQRMERKGQVECRLCTTEGKKLARVQRSKATSETEFFLECARGEIWNSAQLGEKGDLEGVTQAQFPSSTLFPEAF